MPSIELLQKIKAPISHTYQALSTEQGLSNVWTNQLSVEANEGAINTFHFGGNDTVKLKVIRLKPNQSIVWECLESDEEPEWVSTMITFTLEEKNDYVEVLFSHENWKEVSSCYRYCNYNWSMFLLSLKQYCETGVGNPYKG